MITDKKIKKLEPKAKRYTVALGESLFLRVQPTGVKSFVLRVAQGGKVRDFTLGRFPDHTIVQAVQLAHLKREELKIKPSLGMTLRDIFKIWKMKKKSMASFASECQRIELHLLPELGNIPLEKITAPLVFNHLLKLQKTIPTLRRTLMRLNEMLDLAVYSGLLDNNPCRGLSRAFATHQAVNRPFIPAHRLHKLFSACKDCDEWFKLYVLWAVYSMLRPVECCSIKWSWITDNTLTLPPEIMKKRREHRVPLCPEIIKLLARVKELRKHRSSYVWAFGRGGSPINKQHLTKWISTTELKGSLCHHGLRATGRTWLRDEGIAHEIAEDCLAHLSGSTTERAYLRGDYLEQRRFIMAKWWQYIYKEWCSVCEPLEFL